MKSYEKCIKIPIETNFDKIRQHIHKQLLSHEKIVRMVIFDSDKKYFYCELGMVSTQRNQVIEDIFTFSKRPYESSEQFTTVMIVPTGIAAEIGGDSGDAQAAVRLIAQSCDKLITNPNSVNGADHMEAPSNMLYVEGSSLSRFMMGTVGLLPTRKNKILLAVEELDGINKESMHMSINAVSAARLARGIEIDVVKIKSNTQTNCLFSESGRATGHIENIEPWFKVFYENKNKYDAFGISSQMNCDLEFSKKYFRGEVFLNPWSGCEALMTHSLSLMLNKPIVHAPIDTSFDSDNYQFGIVPPAVSSEVVSQTELFCILKGLHQAPKIIIDHEPWYKAGLISAMNINCLIQPDRCIGLPTLAALAQGIMVIAVNDSRNIMKNNLDMLPWQPGQLIHAANYLEAAGIVSALKAGISIESVMRPVRQTKIIV